MTEVGNLKVRLGLDDSGFNKGLSNAERKSKSVGSRIASGLGSVGKAFGKAMLVGTAVGITALASFSKTAIKVASDLEEVQNVVDTVFEGSAETINQFAKTAGTQFGLSELAAKQYAGTMGALLTPSGLGEDAITSMSQELVGLSGDMASFFNIANEEAFNKLRAGISGETEPLKQLGINMSVANLEAFALSQGIDQTFLSMTQAEQATLRYNFIMDATSKVQGDFAKTSESLANQQRIAALNAENLAKVFGTVLLPQAGLAMRGINALITNLMPAFEGLAGGLGDILAGTEGGQKKFQDSAKKIIDGIMKSIKTGLPKIVKIITAFVPVIVDTFTQIIPLIIETFAAEIPGVIEVLTGLIPGIIEALAELIPKLLQFGIDAIIALGQGLAQAVVVLIPTIAQLMVDIVKMLVSNLPLIIKVAIDLIVALVAGILLALPILIKAVPEIIESLVDTIVTLLPMLIDVAIRIIIALVDGIVGAIPLLVEALPKIIGSIVNGLIAILPMLVEAAVEIIMALMTALVENTPLLLGAVVEIGLALVKGIIDLVPQLVNAGWNLIRGLASGMASFDLLGIIEDIGQGIINGFLDFFDIFSPSKKMKKEIGKQLMPGVGEALEEDTKTLKDTLAQSLDSLFGTINVPQVPSLAGAGAGAGAGVGGAGGGDTFEFNTTIVIENGTPEEIGEAGRVFGEQAADSFLRTSRNRGA
ncbi:hypothetical protein KAR91_38215 [Candidatus Pacearchaeota archaeon]|nr:hypothetical protein [Candidatus Pacearchaeota archaeon]